MSEPEKPKLAAVPLDLAWRDFYLTATPKLFEWLRWVGTLAALKYVQQKVHSVALGVLIAVASWLFIMYFGNYFFQFVERDFPVGRGRKPKIIAAAVLAGMAGWITWWLVDRAVDAIVLSQH